MRFNRRDVITGLVIVVVVIAGALLYRNLRNRRNLQSTPAPIPTSNEVKNEIQEMFKYEISDDVDYTDLRDVSGGDGKGIATSNEILADLGEPESRYFYQGWLEDNTGRVVSLGKLTSAKGGWLISYNGAQYPEYKKIVVSLEQKLDNTMEKRILEGSF